MCQTYREEVLLSALQRIADWADAYPLENFPAPDLEADRKLLGDGEFTRLNAAAMRHVITGVGRIARAALGEGVKSCAE